MRANQQPVALLAGMAGRGCGGVGALSALEASARTVEPAMKSLTQANLELTQFWARRIRASLEAPQMLARCRTPQQGMVEAIRLTREAAEDARRTGEVVLRWWTIAAQQPAPLMTAWLAATQSLAPAHAAFAPVAASAQAASKVQRDVITFPERPARRT